MWLSKSISDEIENLFQLHIPVYGKCKHLAGEILRSYMKLTFSFFSGGDMIFDEICISPYNFIYQKCTDENTRTILLKLKENSEKVNEKEYENSLNLLGEHIIHLLGANPEWFETETEDMLDF